ncbi:MAG: hypothetical protein IIC26_05505 [Chloroflexi bacterium]|nr:hypothetical protein [Chloroflexota bacterium]
MGETNATSSQRAAKAGQPGYTRFIILSDARTGSHMLAQALNSSRNIVCFREVFNETLDFIQYGVEGYDNFSTEDKALRQEEPLRFLDERIFCRYPDKIKAVGFKYHYGHVFGFPGVVERLAEDTELRVLHLRRRNKLRSLVSLRFAERTGGWMREAQPEPVRVSASAAAWAAVLSGLSLPGRAVRKTLRLLGLMTPPELPEEGPRIQMTISLEELVHFNIEAQFTADHFDELFQDHPRMELYYEDILDDRERAYTQVQAFLGVEPRPLFDTTYRQHPQPLRELVANYDELYEAVKSGPHPDYYSAFFD